MSLLKKNLKESGRLVTENNDWPLWRVFKDLDWELSGGTKAPGIMGVAWIITLNAKTVVEIGLWQGFTTHILGRALSANAGEEGLLISCDINKKAINNSKIASCLMPIRHKLILGDTKQLKLVEHLDGRLIDVAFIDGSHTYEMAFNDMTLCSKHISNNGVMIIHDYSKNANHRGVVQAVDEFVLHNGYQMLFMPENRESTDYRTVVLQKIIYR